MSRNAISKIGGATDAAVWDDSFKVGKACMPYRCDLPDHQLRADFVTVWKQHAQRLHKEAHVFYFVFKHPQTRWYTRVLAACSAGYLFSPIQLIPSFIPVIGFLDDAVVLFVGAKLVERITPPDVLTECREMADAAESRWKEKVRTRLARFAFVLTVTSWLLGASAATALLATYISH